MDNDRGSKQDDGNKKASGPDMRVIGLIFFMLACALPSIMSSGHSSSSYSETHTPPRREFSEADAGWYEYDYKADGIFWCGSILKWRADWMPKGYNAEPVGGADQTTHNFKTLAEAESFLQSRGCPIASPEAKNEAKR